MKRILYLTLLCMGISSSAHSMQLATQAAKKVTSIVEPALDKAWVLGEKLVSSSNCQAAALAAAGMGLKLASIPFRDYNLINHRLHQGITQIPVLTIKNRWVSLPLAALCSFISARTFIGLYNEAKKNPGKTIIPFQGTMINPESWLGKTTFGKTINYCCDKYPNAAGLLAFLTIFGSFVIPMDHACALLDIYKQGCTPNCPVFFNKLYKEVQYSFI